MSACNICCGQRVSRVLPSPGQPVTRVTVAEHTEGDKGAGGGGLPVTLRKFSTDQRKRF